MQWLSSMKNIFVFSCQESSSLAKGEDTLPWLAKMVKNIQWLNSIVTFLFDPQNYILYTISSDVGITYSLFLSDLNCFCSKMLRDIDGVKFLNWYASKDTNRLLKSKNREQGRDQYKKRTVTLALAWSVSIKNSNSCTGWL